MTRNFAIDLFRLIAAFCIMTLHTNLPGFGYEIGSIIRLGGRWAVPFFFIATGYYLGKKLSGDHEFHFILIEKNVLYLISIFLVSSLVYIIYSISCAKFWFANDVGFLLNGTFGHLWFISSMIVGYITIWYIFNMNLKKYLPAISLVVILLAVLFDSYDLFLGKELDYTQIPRFLISIPFMYAGVFLSGKKINKSRLPVWIIIFFTGFILQYIEMAFFYKAYNYTPYEHQMLIGTVIASISLFIICLSINIKENFGSRLGRKYSLFIYLYHAIGYWGIRKILSVFDLVNNEVIQILMPIIGFLFIVSFAILLDRFFSSAFSVLNGNLNQVFGNARYSKRLEKS